MYDLGEDLKVFIYLCQRGKMVFCLDGFDEIPEKHKNRIALEIEQLARRFHKSKFIISSRPETRIRSSFLFDRIKLCELSKSEQKDFIRHMMEDEVQLKLLHQAIDQSQFISGVVTTPLFLTLLMIAYKSESRIPENMVDFYNLLFPTMMYRHDNTKIGFNREILSKIGTNKFQELFEAFSYISADKNKLRFKSREYYDMLCEAYRYVEIDKIIDDKEIENIQSDITKVICLVIEDGFDEYSFIHKTIQEYFAASFISKSGEENIKNFFQFSLENYENYQTWSQVNLFLFGLSEYLYLKYFFKPLNEKFFRRNKLTKKGIKEIFGEQSIVYVSDDGEVIEYVEQQGYFKIINPVLQFTFRENLYEFLKFHEKEICFYIATIDDLEYIYIHEDSLNDLNILYIYELLDQIQKTNDFYSFINKKMKVSIKEEKERVEAKIAKFNKRSNIIKMPKKIFIS